MCLQSCKTCHHLIENVSLASTRQLGVRLLLETAVKTAVKNDTGDTNILSLARLKNSYDLECREAVDQYRIHLLSHEIRATVTAMAA